MSNVSTALLRMLFQLGGQVLMPPPSPATAIPRITSDFQSLDQVGWYGSAYFMAAMGMQPFFARAYQLFPTKALLCVAVGLMVVGAILTAAAPNSITFIVGRAITGASVAAFYSGGATVITFFVPFQRRPLFLSLSMAMNAVASVLGPVVSGILTDSRLTWRFAFWMNLRTFCCHGIFFPGSLEIYL